MAQPTAQNFENHVRYLPAYHFVAFPLFFINFCYAAYQAVARFGVATVVGLMLAIALVLLFLLSRTMVMTVQDRVIRLEERLRMRALLPADLQPRIDEFTVKQLVALRFASDGELPALARKVVEGRIEDQKAIKQMVTAWRADDQRA
jgi:predicted RND superfamily exporter protein